MSYNLLETVTAFAFNVHKDAQLKEQRGIGFEGIIELIYGGHLLDVVPHSNQKGYPHQYVAAINAQDYVITVPFVTESGDTIWFLKTAYFNRKATSKYQKK